MKATEDYIQTDWNALTGEFNIDRTLVQLGASQFFASHPRAVRAAIQKYAQQLDQSPVLFTQQSENDLMQRCREELAEYFGVPQPDHIAMTDSTTMGLGLLYTALNLPAGCEILTTEHDHYSHHESIRHASARTGASYRRFEMYKNLSEVTKEEIVSSVLREIREETRILGITWVHSSSGLKIPVPEICKAVAELNKGRRSVEKIRILVDGIHGFGIELENFPELGCDYFVSSGHKWIYGPRGTGFIAATHDAWQQVKPIIPSYTDTMDMVIEEEGRPKFIDGKQMTPGGFHSLENRWALADALGFIKSVGKENIYHRVHHLNCICKQGLAEMSHVKVHTPIDDELSAGIIAFEVDGYSTPEVVKALLDQKVIATAAPYLTSWARFTPGIVNTEEEVHKALSAVASLKA